ncbi:methyltransferase domain-containing protein [uncultured Pseudodesulfovibrio sp.]|uniref:methyltransferase domain-containing protein n=1 Tax=uncultured Pseudodesulfovibrio sp. TaxID=2035858 RepID=UPI003748E3E6
MTRFGNNSLAIMELALDWRDGTRTFTDRIVARRMNVWRDIFPPRLRDLLEGKAEGETVRLDYAPGELIPPRHDSLVGTMDTRRFNGPMIGGHPVLPRVGRFYPQGLFSGIAGVYPGTMTPARITALEGRTMTLDRNHPLAGRPLTLTATLQTVQDKVADTGGLLSHWGEELCDNGPGMQARLEAGPTVFLAESFLHRPDDDDARFYAAPRITGHVDARASENLSAMYARHLRPGMAVLDLMSSVQSHLPDDLDLRVTGLGMNGEEMTNNPALAQHVVHDLNIDPAIPVQGPFDAVTLSLSVEYLTDPLAVLQSAHSLLAPGGVILIGVSDRWFPTKAVRGWLELHEFERPGFLLQLLEEAGFTGAMGSESIRHDWRPQDDRHFLETRGFSDPIHAIHAYKK